MTLQIRSDNIIPAITGGVFDFATIVDTPTDIISSSPAYILATFMIENEIGSVTNPSSNLDWPLFISREPKKPANCITIFDTIPVKQFRYMSTGKVFENYGLQLRIRCNNYVDGWTKLEQINSTLDTLKNELVVVDLNEYIIQNVTRTSGVVSLGADVDSPELRIYTSNLIMTMKKQI